MTSASEDFIGASPPEKSDPFRDRRMGVVENHIEGMGEKVGEVVQDHFFERSDEPLGTGHHL